MLEGAGTTTSTGFLATNLDFCTFSVIQFLALYFKFGVYEFHDELVLLKGLIYK